MSDETTPIATAVSATPSQPQPIPTVESESMSALYANYVKVQPSPEELVLDFGLNTNHPGGPTEPIKISQRLVLNYFTAKRLWGGLGMALQRHEQTFGVLETDVNKRVVVAPPRPQR